MNPADHAPADTPADRLRRWGLALAEGIAAVAATIAAVLLLAPGQPTDTAGDGFRAFVMPGEFVGGGGFPPHLRALDLLHVGFDPGAGGTSGSSEWKNQTLGVLRWDYRWASPAGLYRETQTAVGLWALLSVGLVGGVARLAVGAAISRGREEPSPGRRAAANVGRVWLWSAAALGAALVIAPHPDASGWAAGLWVDRVADGPGGPDGRPRLMWGGAEIAAHAAVPWGWVLAAPLAGSLALAGRAAAGFSPRGR